MSEQRLQKFLKFRLAQNLQRWRWKETAMLVAGKPTNSFHEGNMSSQKCLGNLTLMSLSVWMSMLEGQTVTASRVFLCECNLQRYCGNSELYVYMCKKPNADTWSIFNWQSLVLMSSILWIYINFMLTRCTLIHLPLPLKKQHHQLPYYIPCNFAAGKKNKKRVIESSEILQCAPLVELMDTSPPAVLKLSLVVGTHLASGWSCWMHTLLPLQLALCKSTKWLDSF